MKTLFKKELNYYLNNPIGYIIVILFGIFANFMFMKDVFVLGTATMKPFFTTVPWLLLIFIPAVSMRSMAEEKRNNTLETLLTLPLSETQIVISKFLALLTVVGLGLLLTISIPISLAVLTKVYIPEIIIGYVGLLLLSAGFISLSMFFSSQTKNQVIALLLSALSIFILLVLSSDFLSSVLPKVAQDAVTYFSPLYHLQNFVKGILDLRSLIYFLAFTALFLFFTITDLEKRG